MSTNIVQKEQEPTDMNGLKTPGTFDPWAVLKSVQVNPYAEIEKPPIAIEMHSNGKVSPSFTLGNFSMVIGKAKSKKTFLLTGLAAAAVGNSWALDCIKGVLPDHKRAVLYFDTEQSEYHLNRTIKRVLRQSTDLANFKAFGLRKFKPFERLKLIEFAIYSTPNIGLVFIDGLRDLVSSINDEVEATNITSDLLKWTAEKNIHIIVVLHQNKGDLNARGHVGSECLNKAETTLSVTVGTDPDTSLVECEFCRDIPFDPFAFRINEEGLPESSEIPEKATSQARHANPQSIANEKHFSVLTSIYKTNTSPDHVELRAAIIYGFGGQFGESKCREFVTHYLAMGWIEKCRDKKRVIYKYKRALF